MAAQVLSFFQRSPRLAPQPADWTQQELAEFYRVESALIRAGIRVGTDRGMSDENEPWFVFYRSDDGEVVIHFARIDGEYLIAGPAYEEIARGFDFTALVRNMVARHPLIRRSESGSNLSIHPAALLVAVVGTAFFKTGEARANETGASNAQSPHSQAGHHRPALLSSSSSAGLSGGVATASAPQSSGYDTVQLPANQAVMVLAAALLASNYQADTASLSSGAQTAIASAAAALDFGVAPAVSQHGDAAGFTTTTTHAVAVGETPAQMMSSVLSLVALLSTLPQVSDTAATGEASIGPVGLSHQDNLQADQGLPASDTASWTIDVRLNHADISAVEAVQLVRNVVGEASLQKISVIEVAKLPDVLANIIAQGAHFNVGTATPQPGAADIKTPLPQGSDGDGSTTPPQEAKPDPIDTAPTPSTPTSSSYIYKGFATVDLVRNFIDYFVAHTHDVQIMTQGREIVMYDTRVMSDPGSLDHVTSLTFHFFDGSSINLVGHDSAFLNGGILV